MLFDPRRISVYFGRRFNASFEPRLSNSPEQGCVTSGLHVRGKFVQQTNTNRYTRHVSVIVTREFRFVCFFLFLSFFQEDR